jgi:hypothetical protein
MLAMENYSRNFEINDDKEEINLGYIILNSKASLLEEVTVNQEKPPVTFKKDTIEFNAGSFKQKQIPWLRTCCLYYKNSRLSERK